MALVNRNTVTQQKHIIPSSLTHNAGVITAVVNGVSYPVSLSGLTANTLYFLYLRINAGTAQLFFVTTVPSTYRASFPEAKLVGAFYSNGFSSVAFGAFVTIEGIPVSNTWSGEGIDIESGGVNLNKGTVATDRYTITRVGDKIEFAFVFYKVVADGSATAGQWVVRPPSQFVVDNSKMPNIGGENFRNRNSGHLTNSGDGRIGLFNWGGSGEFGFQYANGATNSLASTTSHSFPTSTWSWNGLIEFPVVGLTNTPLKDL